MLIMKVTGATKDSLILGEYIMPREEIDIILERGDLSKMIGRNKKCVVIDADKKIVSRRKLQERQREIVVGQLEAGEVKTGTICSIKGNGAYLTIDGVLCILKDCDFAVRGSTTKCQDILKKGDELSVVLKSVSQTGRIHVQAEQKYGYKATTLSCNAHVIAKVTGLIDTGYFVETGKGEQLLCNSIAGSPSLGDSVIVKVTKVFVKNGNNCIRGLITGFNNDFYEEEVFVADAL